MKANKINDYRERNLGKKSSPIVRLLIMRDDSW